MSEKMLWNEGQTVLVRVNSIRYFSIECSDWTEGTWVLQAFFNDGEFFTLKTLKSETLAKEALEALAKEALGGALVSITY